MLARSSPLLLRTAAVSISLSHPCTLSLTPSSAALSFSLLLFLLPPPLSQNIFAKILAGEIPSYKIFETEHALAILDAFPITPGHALLLPKHACSSITDMPAHVASSVLSELPRLARMVQQATGAPGVNVVTNSGEAAGQVVFHAHIHVIPRFSADGLVALKPSRSSMISSEEVRHIRWSDGSVAFMSSRHALIMSTASTLRLSYSV